jgi:hypothetical protein
LNVHLSELSSWVYGKSLCREALQTLDWPVI